MISIRFFIRLAAILILLHSTAHAADVKSLIELFQKNYNSFYQQGYCGRNTARLVQAAVHENIDLSNAYVLKIVGSGFLETSGFYTRNSPHKREMLGYFHVVLVADNYVFDFDLHEPLVLPIEDYVRLQFTPPYEPFEIWGIQFMAKKELPHWEVTQFNWQDYIKQKEVIIEKMKFNKFIDLDSVMSRQRLK